MINDIEKISLNLTLIPCEEGLEKKILATIQKEQKRKAKIKFELFGLSLISSGSFFVYVFSKIFSDFQSSVFSDYASILISDSKFALMNWKQTLLLLLESAPIVDIFLIVSMLGILLYLLSKTTKEASLFLRPELIYK